MNQPRIFPFGVGLAAVRREPLVLLLIGLLALSWQATAVGEEAEDRAVVPETVATSSGETVLESPHWVTPRLPNDSKQPPHARSQVIEAQLLQPDPPSIPKLPVLAKPQEVDAELDPEPPSHPKRPAVAKPQGDSSLLPDSDPPKKPGRTAVVKPQPNSPRIPDPVMGRHAVAADDDSESAVEMPQHVPVPHALPPRRGCDSCDSCDRCATCAPMGGCGSCPASRLWVRGEYLLWWEKGFSTPPLVTTSPSDTSQSDAGILTTPGTTILAGSDVAGSGARSGERISLGYWLDRQQSYGVEAIYSGLALKNWQSAFDSGSMPILARPFFRLEPSFVGQDAELVAYPGALQGNVQVSGSTELQMVEILWRNLLLRTPCDRIDFLAGWRYNRLDDSLLIQDSKTSLDAASGFAVGTNLQEFDLFKTQNQFNGPEIGIITEMQRQRWTLELSMKLALGNNNTRVSIAGQTTTSVPVSGGSPLVSTRPSGLLAQPSNIGVYESNELAVVPELGVTLGCQLTRRLRATAGYTFTYWDNVARPGDQVDQNLNLTQLTSNGLSGAAVPKFVRVESDFWAQGLNLGLDYRF